MHVALTFKNWMHDVHDDTLKAAQNTGQMLHQKSFWGIVAIVALIVSLFMLIAFFGDNTIMDYQTPPLPYGGF